MTRIKVAHITTIDLSLRYLKRELRADNPEQQQLSLLDAVSIVEQRKLLLLRVIRA